MMLTDAMADKCCRVLMILYQRCITVFCLKRDWHKQTVYAQCLIRICSVCHSPTSIYTSPGN